MMKAKDVLKEVFDAIDEVAKLHPAENGNVQALMVRMKRDVENLPDWCNIDLDDDFEDDDTGVDADDVGRAAGMKYSKIQSPVSGVKEPGIVNTPEGPKVGTGALMDNQPPFLNSPKDKPVEGKLEDAPAPGTEVLPPNPDKLQADVDAANASSGGVNEEEADEEAEDKSDAGNGKRSGLKGKAAKAK
jgi:hypothetical protein